MRNNEIGIVNNKLVTGSKSRKYVCQATKDLSKKKEIERKELYGEIQRRD